MTAPNIVQINVTQTIAPAPSTLQRTGAFISQGGTNTASGTLSLLTQLSDLTPLLAGAKTITAMTWLSSVVTATATGHGFPIGSVIQLVVSGVTPTAYNGTFNATIVDANTITYGVATNPGVVTIQGVVTNIDVSELVAQATTFFAQGFGASVYVLELGAGTYAQGVTTLSTYLTNNVNTIYLFNVPRGWDGEPTFVTLASTLEATTAKVYFVVTATLSTYSSFTALFKSVFMLIEAPSIPVTEFTSAGVFAKMLSYNPSPSNQVGPLAFSYVSGVTAYPATSVQQSTFKTANLNYVTTGAEGGISNTMLVWGHMADGNPFNYWYSIDYTQINLELNLTNEVINGSNNSLAPLYYNQAGINRLQNRAVSVAKQVVANGLALGTVIAVQQTASDFINSVNAGTYNGYFVINAVPFTSYNSLAPSDYKLGKYAGMSCAYTPARGFEQIIVNLNATQFVA